MGKIKLFPTPEYTSKQASDPVVPCTGIFLGPSKSGKTVALISLILEQYKGVFERIYVFSPSVNIDDGWIPVKKYIEQDLGVNTERERCFWPCKCVSVVELCGSKSLLLISKRFLGRRRSLG